MARLGDHGLCVGEAIVLSLPFNGSASSTAKQLLSDVMQLEKHGVASTRAMLLNPKFTALNYGYAYE